MDIIRPSVSEERYHNYISHLYTSMSYQNTLSMSEYNSPVSPFVTLDKTDLGIAK